jgi:hypothetical protein
MVVFRRALYGDSCGSSRGRRVVAGYTREVARMAVRLRALLVAMGAIVLVVAGIWVGAAGGATRRADVLRVSGGDLIENLAVPSTGGGAEAAFTRTGGTVTAYVAVPLRFDRHGVAIRTRYVPVRTVPLAQASAMPVPVSGRLMRRATNRAGLAYFMFIARHNNKESVSLDTLPTMPVRGRGFVADAAMLRASTHRFLRFAPWHSLGRPGAVVARARGSAVPANNGPCGSRQIKHGLGNPKVGQIQTSQASYASGTFEYSTQADSNFDVGISYSSPNGNFSNGGNASVSNSLGGSGSLPVSWGTDEYVRDNQYWTEQQMQCASGSNSFSVYYTQSVGNTDVQNSDPNPPLDPWGRCSQAPSGPGILYPGASWSQDRNRAITLGLVGTLFGFNFSGWTGYTNGITISLHNKASNNELFFCGSGQLPNVPALYENNGSGQ